MMLRWWGTLLYPMALVALFLGIQGLLSVAGVPPEHQASLAAVPAVAVLLISLPLRLQRVWAESRPWQRLGVIAPWRQSLTALSGGLLAALLLLLLELLGLALTGSLQWQWNLSAGLWLNAVALGLGVGFAEELLFRGWLLGELTLLLGPQRALLVQAALFSVVHTRFHLPPLLLLLLLGGLLLLGVALGIQRRCDGGVLWGAVGLHGGLVGGWFMLSQGMLELSKAGPAWLISPENPIGGVVGWCGLLLLLAWLRCRG